MRIQFSNNALERMRSRNLTTDQIKEAVKPNRSFKKSVPVQNTFILIILVYSL